MGRQPQEQLSVWSLDFVSQLVYGTGVGQFSFHAPLLVQTVSSVQFGIRELAVSASAFALLHMHSARVAMELSLAVYMLLYM